MDIYDLPMLSAGHTLCDLLEEALCYIDFFPTDSVGLRAEEEFVKKCKAAIKEWRDNA